MSDWTGSAAQRRPQLACRPPKPTSTIECDWIPAGTPVMVRRKGTSEWKNHTTKIKLEIEVTIKRTANSIMFATGDYLVAVAKKHVRTAHESNGP